MAREFSISYHLNCVNKWTAELHCRRKNFVAMLASGAHFVHHLLHGRILPMQDCFGTGKLGTRTASRLEKKDRNK